MPTAKRRPVNQERKSLPFLAQPDLDRQLFPFATPSQLADHVAEVHEALYDPRGGLMLVAEISPDIPLANIDAIATALEKVCKLPEL